MFVDLQDKAVGACDEVLAKNVADMLNKHYPGHLWGVHVRGDQGVVQVFNLSLSGDWGFTLHLSKLDGGLKKVMRAGGELLERYRISRGRVNHNEILGVKRDIRGDAIADV